MEKYLKPKQYYIDLYDRVTIEHCRDLEKDYQEQMKDRIGKKVIEKDRAIISAFRLATYFVSGEDYLKKEETVNKWMKADQEKDELLENAKPPINIVCKNCGSIMDVSLRTLHHKHNNKEDEVIFFFKCSSGCKKQRAFFTDGEEYLSRPHFCKKCQGETKEKNKRDGNKIITIYVCLNCNYEETEVLNLSTKKEKEDKNFEKDRVRFCLNEEQGKKYYNSKASLEILGDFIKEIKVKEENKELYDKAGELEKLTINDLEKRLVQTLKKDGYVKFELGKPEINKYFIVDFSVRDEQSGRNRNESEYALKKIIKLTLKNTNWRLMSDGVIYRAGFITGRFKCYESEEELLKLVK